jgi:Raf kinase inhibitor-like YbhB/YbcL family protein
MDLALRRRGYCAAMVSAVLAMPELMHIQLFAAGVEPANAGSVGCLRMADFQPLQPEPDWEGVVYYAWLRRPETPKDLSGPQSHRAEDGCRSWHCLPGPVGPTLACRRPQGSLARCARPILFLLPLIGVEVQMNGPNQGTSAPLAVASPDLAGDTFPREFTCDSANRLPRLQWSTPPADTQELAIELLDPDAPGGTFTHWLAYGIPASLSGLVAVPADGAEGVNEFGRRGYGGPCPPRGPAHHHHFVILALDIRLGLAAGATRSDLEARISGHALGKGELVATCQRA